MDLCACRSASPGVETALEPRYCEFKAPAGVSRVPEWKTLRNGFMHGNVAAMTETFRSTISVMTENIRKYVESGFERTA